MLRCSHDSRRNIRTWDPCKRNIRESSIVISSKLYVSSGKKWKNLKLYFTISYIHESSIVISSNLRVSSKENFKTLFRNFNSFDRCYPIDSNICESSTVISSNLRVSSRENGKIWQLYFTIPYIHESSAVIFSKLRVSLKENGKIRQLYFIIVIPSINITVISSNLRRKKMEKFDNFIYYRIDPNICESSIVISSNLRVSSRENGKIWQLYFTIPYIRAHTFSNLRREKILPTLFHNYNSFDRYWSKYSSIEHRHLFKLVSSKENGKI